MYDNITIISLFIKFIYTCKSIPKSCEMYFFFNFIYVSMEHMKVTFMPTKSKLVAIYLFD